MAKRKRNNTMQKRWMYGLFGLGALIVLAIVLILVRTNLETDEVVAYVNGEAITFKEFEQIKASVGMAGLVADDSMVLEQLINQKLIIQEAKALGITVEPEEFNTTLSAYFAQTGMTKQEIVSMLESQGISFEDFEHDVLERLIIYKYINQTIMPKVDTDDGALLEYYTSNIEAFFVPEMVEASHILVNSSELAEELLARLVAGEPFAELAQQYSTDISAEMDGWLGWFAYESMIPSFSEAAFSLQPGELSDIVQTQFGYHIILLLNRTESATIEFDDVKPQIRAFVEAEKQTELLMEEITRLNEAADIKIMLPDSKSSFEFTDDEVCLSEGKPIVRLYTTSTCPHCAWIKPAFSAVVSEYEGFIDAAIWELDTGDNLLTTDIETQVPAAEKARFFEYSPQGAVPAFVFGCAYSRVGNAYETSNQLQKEASEFRVVLDSLII
jgi:parvulin-like peptidyl-prolyl isomerase